MSRFREKIEREVDEHFVRDHTDRNSTVYEIQTPLGTAMLYVFEAGAALSFDHPSLANSKLQLWNNYNDQFSEFQWNFYAPGEDEADHVTSALWRVMQQLPGQISTEGYTAAPTEDLARQAGIPDITILTLSPLLDTFRKLCESDYAQRLSQLKGKKE